MAYSEVRMVSGVPLVRDFASTSGSPIVVNVLTAIAYFLAPGDVVTPLGGGGGAGGPTFRAHSVVGTGYTVLAAANVPQKYLNATVDFDTDSCYSAANSRFTPNKAGYYHLSGSASAAGTTYLVAIVSKNGAGAAGSYGNLPYFAGTAATTIVQVSDLVFLDGITDYVEIWIQAGTAPVTVGGQGGDYISGFFVRGP